MLRGEWSRDEALKRGAQATRNYAKRQYHLAEPPVSARLASIDVI